MVDIFQEKYFAWQTLWTPLTPWPTPSSRLKHIGRPHCYPQHDRHQHQYCHHCHMNSLSTFSTSSTMHFSVSSRLENCHFYVSEISTILLTKNLYIVYLFKTISQNLHWWFLQIRDNYISSLHDHFAIIAMIMKMIMGRRSPLERIDHLQARANSIQRGEEANRVILNIFFWGKNHHHDYFCMKIENIPHSLSLLIKGNMHWSIWSSF